MFWLLYVQTCSCVLTQSGHDGMGHQLHGIITIAALEKHSKLYFPHRAFEFQHIDGITKHNVEAYFNATWTLLQRRHPTNRRFQLQRIGETWDLPTKCNSNIAYVLDNAFYHPPNHCNPLFELSNKLKFLFWAHLPRPANTNATLVVHIRLGDSGRRGSARLEKRLQWIRRQLLSVVIHTDEPNRLGTFSSNVVVRGKDYDPLHAFSEMVHAPLFLGADSSLSRAASFLRNNPTFFEAELSNQARASCNNVHGALKMAPHILI